MEDTPENIGEHLLELYIVLHGEFYLNNDDKRDLRLCSKKIKTTIDATIFSAEVDDEGIHALVKCKWPLTSLRVFPTLQKINAYDWGRFKYHNWGPWNPLADKITTLAELHESIGQLSSLQELVIYPALRSVPSSISQLTKLEKLILSCTLDKKIKTRPLIPSLPSLKSLQLTLFKHEKYKERYVNLANAVFNFPSLEELKLEADFLCSFPDKIGNLKNLHTLSLKSMEWRELPVCFKELSLLKVLRITCCNCLTALPEFCGDLITLEELSVRCCHRLQALPNSLGSLKNLKILDVSGCLHLSCVPDSIGDLESLKELSIFLCNKITSMPDSVRNLTLDVLDIHRCPELKFSEALKDVFNRLPVVNPSFANPTVKPASAANRRLGGSSLRGKGAAFGYFKLENEARLQAKYPERPIGPVLLSAYDRLTVEEKAVYRARAKEEAQREMLQEARQEFLSRLGIFWYFERFLNGIE